MHSFLPFRSLHHLQKQYTCTTLLGPNQISAHRDVCDLFGALGEYVVLTPDKSLPLDACSPVIWNIQGHFVEPLGQKRAIKRDFCARALFAMTRLHLQVPIYQQLKATAPTRRVGRKVAFIQTGKEGTSPK
jgi:hypothetical protein